jgi:hypothetical protein
MLRGSFGAKEPLRSWVQKMWRSRLKTRVKRVHKVSLALGVALLAIVLAGCSSASLHAKRKATVKAQPIAGGVFPGCWPNCKPGTPRDLLFGVAVARFTIGTGLGIPAAQPVEPDLDMERLKELAGGHPFFVHMYAEWDSGISPSFLAAIKRYRREGFLVNLALRYYPPPGKGNDPRGFARWVAKVIPSLPEVKVFQVTNEANVDGSKDSDGYFKGARHAVVDGIEAAAKVKAPGQLIGFNYAVTPDKQDSIGFFRDLAKLGGRKFAEDLSFVGIDAYPGTYWPLPSDTHPAKALSQELAQLRDVFMPALGVSSRTPIFIQEIGWPSFSSHVSNTPEAALERMKILKAFGKALIGRTAQRQGEVLADFIRAARGYGVRLMQWFDLTDARDGLGDKWGLLTAHYQPKPAFEVLAHAVHTGES